LERERERGITKVNLFFPRPNGMSFTVPEQNVQVPNLKIGDVVTFSYESYSRKHVPVNPVIHRVRTDLSWHNLANTLTGMKIHAIINNLAYIIKIINTSMFQYICRASAGAKNLLMNDLIKKSTFRKSPNGTQYFVPQEKITILTNNKKI
jgi:hypothetical protein